MPISHAAGVRQRRATAYRCAGWTQHAEALRAKARQSMLAECRSPAETHAVFGRIFEETIRRYLNEFGPDDMDVPLPLDHPLDVDA
ncbi:MAG: hypothetical protein AAF074_12335 [Pseudomonadota bacterium]